MTNTAHTHKFIDYYRSGTDMRTGTATYKAVCSCGYCCAHKPSIDAAKAAVEAHIAKAAR